MTCWRDHPQGDAWSSLKTGIEKLVQEKDGRWLKEIKVLKDRCREIEEEMRKETKEKKIEIENLKEENVRIKRRHENMVTAMRKENKEKNIEVENLKEENVRIKRRHENMALAMKLEKKMRKEIHEEKFGEINKVRKETQEGMMKLEKKMRREIHEEKLSSKVRFLEERFEIQMGFNVKIRENINKMRKEMDEGKKPRKLRYEVKENIRKKKNKRNPRGPK